MTRTPTPDSISDAARQLIENLPGADQTAPFPEPDDLAGWQRLQQAFRQRALAWQSENLQTESVIIEQTLLGSLPALDMRPARSQPDADSPVLVYLHGGGYTCFNADTSMQSAVSLVELTGYRVLSLEYPLAPENHWQTTVSRVADAMQVLLQQVDGRQVVVLGESAGGGLAAGSLLWMRDHGQPLPAALVLWSPWLDVTGSGDSYQTLAGDDPVFLYEPHLGRCAAAYAAPDEQRIPYVSPVYADYASGFVPTLIQGGTRELLLSDFVRFYQALDAAGIAVKLDLYDGMPHGFHGLLADAPEGRLAREKSRVFIERCLDQHQDQCLEQ